MLEIAIVWICLLLNALLSASEIAFVSVNRQVLHQLESKFPRRVRRLGRLRQAPERTLSVIQLGITMVGFVSGAVSGAGIEESAVPWMRQRWGWGETTAELVGIALVVVPLTALTVLFGELVPKALALRRPYRIAIAVSGLLWLLDRAFSPLIAFFAGTTRRIVSGLSRVFSHGRISQDTAQIEGAEGLDSHHERLLINLAEFETRSVGEVFIPWSEAISVERNQSLEEVIGIAIDTGHTRLPVCRQERVQGLVHTKELIAFASQGGTDWMLLLRPILRVQASDSLLGLLKRMQEKHSHMAIVEGEDSRPLGFLTLENLMESIVGHIYDEDDRPLGPWK
ncbi:MAG TPA: CNNM domain-containing protein [bacterium]|nr:CNNM domain-containing protein [bacterium]